MRWLVLLALLAVAFWVGVPITMPITIHGVTIITHVTKALRPTHCAWRCWLPM